MTDYATLLRLIAPVFALIAAGLVARRVGWLGAEADASLLKLVVNFLYPCLILQNVLGNELLRDPRNLVWPPLLGFALVVLGLAVGFLGGKATGLARGQGLRTFMVAVGLFNYGYIPIPLVTSLFSAETLGVLFVFSLGVETALWTVGLMVLAGGSLREGWRRLLNPPVVSIALGLSLNAIGADTWLPEPVHLTLAALAACAIPLGLMLIGAGLDEHLDRPRDLVNIRTIGAAALLRLGLLPLLFLLVARFAPLSVELKQVLVVQAAMPAAVFPIVMAKHYGGHPLTAVQVGVGTTALAIVTIPWWLQVGLRFVQP
jgi:predicted permease